jgi:tetratricopeptide (TPR) repeat protein
MTQRKDAPTYFEKMAELLMLEGDVETAKAMQHLAKARVNKIPSQYKNKSKRLIDKANRAIEYGDFERATLFLQELYQLAFDQVGPDHMTTLEHMLSLAQCLREERKLDQALDLFSKASQIAMTNLGETHVLTRQASEGAKNCKDAIRQDRGFSILSNKFDLFMDSAPVFVNILSINRINHLKKVADKLLNRNKQKLARSFFKAWFEANIEQYGNCELNYIEELTDYAKSLYQSGNKEEAFECYRQLVRATAMRSSQGSSACDMNTVLQDFADYLNVIGQKISAKATLELVHRSIRSM